MKKFSHLLYIMPILAVWHKLAKMNDVKVHAHVHVASSQFTLTFSSSVLCKWGFCPHDRNLLSRGVSLKLADFYENVKDKQEFRGGRKISNGSILQTVFSASFFSCLPLDDAQIHNLSLVMHALGV